MEKRAFVVATMLVALVAGISQAAKKVAAKKTRTITTAASLRATAAQNRARARQLFVQGQQERAKQLYHGAQRLEKKAESIGAAQYRRSLGDQSWREFDGTLRQLQQFSQRFAGKHESIRKRIRTLREEARRAKSQGDTKKAKQLTAKANAAQQELTSVSTAIENAQRRAMMSTFSRLPSGARMNGALNRLTHAAQVTGTEDQAEMDKRLLAAAKRAGFGVSDTGVTVSNGTNPEGPATAGTDFVAQPQVPAYTRPARKKAAPTAEDLKRVERHRAIYQKYAARMTKALKAAGAIGKKSDIQKEAQKRQLKDRTNEELLKLKGKSPTRYYRLRKASRPATAETSSKDRSSKK